MVVSSLFVQNLLHTSTVFVSVSVSVSGLIRVCNQINLCNLGGRQICAITRDDFSTISRVDKFVQSGASAYLPCNHSTLVASTNNDDAVASHWRKVASRTN